MWLAALLGFAGGCKVCKLHTTQQENDTCGANTLQDHSHQLATNLQIAVDTVWQFVAS